MSSAILCILVLVAVAARTFVEVEDIEDRSIATNFYCLSLISFGFTQLLSYRVLRVTQAQAVRYSFFLLFTFYFLQEVHNILKYFYIYL